MSKQFIAEWIGTFALAFIVMAGVSAGAAVPMIIPVLAALTLGLFVYTIGGVSGCHLNPAITLGLLSIKIISVKRAFEYIVAQIGGAVTAVILANVFGFIDPVAVTAPFAAPIFAAEALGAFFFAFGVAAVVKGSVLAPLSGVVVGGSLLFGILVASLAGAAGIVNPAVAFALNTPTLTYLLAPVIGSVIGFQVYKFLSH